MKTEFQIRDEILEFLHKKGIMAWKDKQQTTKYIKGTRIKGIPDILGYLNDGTFLGIEVKKPGEKLTKEQDEFIQRATSHGTMCFVARSLDDVMKRFL